MANILLGVTGSVAAIKTAELYAALGAAGHEVKIIATAASLYFFDPVSIHPKDGSRDPEVVVLDEDEWPGGEQGERYARGDDVLHIELRRWAHCLVVAPLDANTLAKLALGLSNNCLTCVWRAWDRSLPRVLAPAMNTLMWTAPATVRHLRLLAEDEEHAGTFADGEAGMEWINTQCPRLRIVPPVEKRLACEDVGVGGLAEVERIVAVVVELLAESSPKVPR